MALSPTAPAPATPALMPSPSLLANFRQDLARYPPFAQMDAAGIDFFLTHCEQRYYGPGEVLVQPADGVVREIFFIRQGAVSGVRGLADLSGGAFQYEAGDLFPLSAAVAQRAVTATYSAAADTFVEVAARTLLQRLGSDETLAWDLANEITSTACVWIPAVRG